LACALGGAVLAGSRRRSGPTLLGDAGGEPAGDRGTRGAWVRVRRAVGAKSVVGLAAAAGRERRDAGATRPDGSAVLVHRHAVNGRLAAALGRAVAGIRGASGTLRARAESGRGCLAHGAGAVGARL